MVEVLRVGLVGLEPTTMGLKVALLCRLRYRPWSDKRSGLYTVRQSACVVARRQDPDSSVRALAAFGVHIPWLLSEVHAIREAANHEWNRSPRQRHWWCGAHALLRC